MKFSKIQMAVGALMAVAAGNASALALSTIDGSEVKLYVSGATATDNAFANLARLKSLSGGLCQDGTLDSYEYSVNGTVNQRLNYCMSSGNGGIAANLRIMIAKESVSGSAAGISPVARATARAFLPFSAANLAGGGLGTCETAQSTPVASTGDFAAYTKHSCDSSHVTLTSVVPTAGISDIDPTTFVGLGGVTASDASKLSATSTVAVSFNPIVSVALYRALQSAQGLTQDDTLANTPSLTLSQLRGVFSGFVTDGSQLWSRNASGSNAQVSTVSKEIKVCRRGNTSGTMASFKILFLGEGCSKNPGSIGSFVLPDSVFTNPNATGEVDVLAGQVWDTAITLYTEDGTPINQGYGGVRVFAGSGSGDVRNCVGFHSAANGGGTAGNFAVGTASTESKPAVGNTFRYIRIDGVEPTLKAGMEGRYPYFTENTINRSNVAAASNFLSGNSLALYNAVIAQIGKSSVLKNINSSWRDAASIGGALTGEADTGILDIPTASNNFVSAGGVLPIANASPRSFPVNGQTRNYTGAVNNCNMATQLFP